jgi:ABC-2 type transport system ATP-binding protein
MSAIEVRDLVKRYPRLVAVDGVTFEVAEGEILGVVGPNGAGKTTTVECIAGLRKPDGGLVRVFGLDPRDDAARVREILGIQLQSSQLPDRIRVREALDLYASFYREPADVDELLSTMGLDDKRDDFFERLSGGQKQRLSIALALVGNPRVAILDEITTGLDPQARRETWSLIETIRARGVTVLLVTHFMEEAERLCDRVAVIDKGKLIALDKPASLVAHLGAEQTTIRFKTRTRFRKEVLTEVPGVTCVERYGSQVLVRGGDDLLLPLAKALSHNRIKATDLRMEQGSLDDAFLELTGQPVES